MAQTPHTSAQLLAVHNDLLRRIAYAEPLASILDVLALSIETQLAGGIASILLCEGDRLRSLAAPHLPSSYTQAIDGVLAEEGFGSCGTAVARRAPVIVANIAQSRLWQRFHTLAADHQLQACWSYPIVAKDDRVLGVLGIYYREVRSPQPHELEIVSLAANIAGIAIERDQTTQALYELNETLERKVAERTTALEESEKRLQCALRGTNDAIWDWDIIHDRVFYSNRWKTMRGLPEDAISDSAAEWQSRLHPDDFAAVMKALQNHLAGHTEFFEVECRSCCQDGSYIWVLNRGQAQRDTAGNLIRMSGMETDIGDRKQAEANLQAANEQLALSNRELQQATQLKNEFLANMSHELRTPLNAILGLSEALQEEAFGHLSDRQQQSLKTIERSGQHLLSLINDILDVSKIEAGKLELEITPVPINQLCDASLSFVHQLALQKQIRLEKQLVPHLGTIAVDARRLRQVLINLLSNAVKFTPEGGAIILSAQRRSHAVAPPTVPVKPEVTHPSSWVEFAITDTGIGIAQADQAKIFQPFTQLDSGLSRKYAGTGLGLTLVKQIVGMHNGTVSVRSQVGHGSCFTICLPDTMSGEVPSGLLSHYSPTANPLCTSVDNAVKPLVLLAEDNPANFFTIKSYLEAKGYQIVMAHDGQTAIDVTQTLQPDLILMDIHMPSVNGLEAIHTIRKIPQTAQIPIIALTALAMPEDSEKCLAAGANRYLTKPVRLKQLITEINLLLTRDAPTD